MSQTLARIFLISLSILAFQKVTIRVHTGEKDVDVTVARNGGVISKTLTNAQGIAEFSLPPNDYKITVEKAGFERQTRRIERGSVEVSFQLVRKIEIQDSVTITGTEEKSATAASSEFQRDQLQQLANKPTTVADALPLIPGISRSPDGEINISGNGELRSALIVNAADVTDPATGQFGMTIPVDV